MGEMTGLAYFIRHNLFEPWKKDRQPIERKWQKNLDAFNAVSSDFWKKGEADDWRSDTFIGQTKIKILSAYAAIVDILLQGGKLSFSFEQSPWDEVVFEELSEPEKSKILDDISDMKKLIEQQLEDCQADRQVMKCVMSGARYGETYIKLLVHPVRRVSFNKISLAAEGYVDESGQFDRFENKVDEVVSPGFEYASVWSIFRDLESDDLQEGVGYIQQGFSSSYDLRKLKGKPNYIDDAIDRAIARADKPGDRVGTKESDVNSLPPGLRGLKYRHNTIERLECWIRVPATIIEAFEVQELSKSNSPDLTGEQFEWDGNDVYILAEMADDEIIKFKRVNKGDRPLRRVEWEINLDQPFGIGVADNLESTQKVLNGMIRAFEDNKKLSANVILALKSRFIAGWDGALKPGKPIEIAEECDDARKAIQQLVIQDVGESLLSGIALMERYGDEQSNIPRIMQGTVATKQKPDTFSELQMLQQNAGKYIGSIIKNFDEGLIEPVISWFYWYNMLDPDVKRGKGNYIARAGGFSTFIARVVRIDQLMRAISLATSSPGIAMEVKMRGLLEEIFESLDIDADTGLKSFEEKEKDQALMVQSQMNAQKNALQMAEIQAVQSAKIATEAKVKEIEADLDSKIKEMEVKHKLTLDEMAEKFQNDLILKKVGAKPVEEKKEPNADRQAG